MKLSDDLVNIRMALTTKVSAPMVATAVAGLDRVEAEISRLERERIGGGDDYRLRMLSNARERMHAAEERAEAAEAEAARLRDGLRGIEDSALKAAQLLPMTLSTSVEADHRDDHSSWAGWLLRHKVLPVARALLAEGDGREPDGYRTEGGRVIPTDR